MLALTISIAVNPTGLYGPFETLSYVLWAPVSIPYTIQRW